MINFCFNRKPFICLHFARGECDAGAECVFLHRIPTAEDEEGADTFHDIFGREKHRDERDDLGGVGSFNRVGKTLYIGGLHNARARKMEKILYAYFGSFGELEYVRVMYERSIAFVRYIRRTSAEFAKEASHVRCFFFCEFVFLEITHSYLQDRPLLVGEERKEVLNVRWANDDPNPVAQQRDHNVQVPFPTSPLSFISTIELTTNNNNNNNNMTGRYVQCHDVHLVVPAGAHRAILLPIPRLPQTPSIWNCCSRR